MEPRPLARSNANDSSAYGNDFFAGIAEGARRSANAVVLIIEELFAPRSLIDIGGGAGHWAAAFRAIGVADTLTVDGPWVPQSARVVPAESFREHDLSRPLALERQFDVAMSLEAAEHLSPDAAAGLIRVLTEAAPIVIFSAALPGQGGDGHINEQRASYWAKMFDEQDYACFTDLRSRAWHNEAIEVWYRQNLLCFIRRSELPLWTDRLSEQREPDDPLLDVAHPDLVLRQRGQIDRAETYAARIEKDAARLRSELEQSRADLAATRRELVAITSSRVWRGWQKIEPSMQRLTRIFSPRQDLRSS